MVSLHSPFVIVGLIAGVIILLFWNIGQQLTIRRLRQRQRIFLQGKDGKNLEEVIWQQQEAWQKLSKQIKRLFEINDNLTQASQKSLRKVGLVRFNPFKNLGGNQSFSIALLNDHLNGLVITSLYHENGSRIYAKTIINGESQKEFPLTEEEKKAIQIAINNR